MSMSHRTHPSRVSSRPCRAGSGDVLLALVLALCITSPTAAATPEAPPEPNRIYFHAATGQNLAQQGRDRYECFLESARAARFNPSALHLPPPYRVSIVPSRSPITPAERPNDALPGETSGGLALGERANRYRLLVRQCLMKRGYAVR